LWSLGESFDDGIAPRRVQGKRRVGLPSVIRDISHNVLKLLAICLCDSLDLASGQERATSRILASDHVMPQTQHQTANDQGWIHRGLIQKVGNRTPGPTHPCIETIHMQENAPAPIAGCFGCEGITSWIAALRFASVLASRVTCAPLLANSMATSLPILRKPRHKSDTSASAVELHRPQWLAGCSSELCLPVLKTPGLFSPPIRLTPVSHR
jgi:hypothetical protein